MFAEDIIPIHGRQMVLPIVASRSHLPEALASCSVSGAFNLADSHPIHIRLVRSLIAVIFFILRSEPNFKETSGSGRSLWKIIRDQRFVSLQIVNLAFSLSLTSYFAFLKPFAESVGLTTVASLFHDAFKCCCAHPNIWLLFTKTDWENTGAITSLECLTVGGILLIAHVPTTWDLRLAHWNGMCGIGHGYGFPIIFLHHSLSRLRTQRHEEAS